MNVQTVFLNRHYHSLAAKISLVCIIALSNTACVSAFFSKPNNSKRPPVTVTTIVIDDNRSSKANNNNHKETNNSPTPTNPQYPAVTQPTISTTEISTLETRPADNLNTLVTPNVEGVHSLFICDDITPYINKVVGGGECVDLLKTCANVSFAHQWQQGAMVWNNKVPTGTAIATFKNGVYPSRRGYHAAIYISQDDKGIYVWDQWQGKAVHTRLITADNNKLPGNNAYQYRVIR